MANNVKPTQSEDEYFVREDAEKKRKIALAAKKETEKAERERLKKLHWMRCPKCGMEMHEVQLHGATVDVCFSCNGIFLDQGELEHFQKTRPGPGVVDAVLNWFKPETKKAT